MLSTCLYKILTNPQRSTERQSFWNVSFHEVHETRWSSDVVQAGQHQEPHVHASEAFTAIAFLGVVCHEDAQREIIRPFTGAAAREENQTFFIRPFTELDLHLSSSKQKILEATGRFSVAIFAIFIRFR